MNNNTSQKPVEYTRNDLNEYIMELLGLSSITPVINKQINRFILEDNMTFKEIARCLCWYTEVEHGVLRPQFGIAIVPNIRDAANQYFKQLELDQQRQSEEAKKIVEYQENNIIFHINSLKHTKRKPKQLDINNINIKGDINDD